MSSGSQDESNEGASRPTEHEDGGRPSLGSRFGDLLASPLRGSAYVTREAHRRRSDRFIEAGVPRPRLSPRTALEVTVDELTISTFRLVRSLPGAEEWERYREELDALLPLVRSSGLLSDPRPFHPEPDPAQGTVRSGRGSARGLELMSFDSEWTPDPAWPGSARWEGYAANGRARVYLLRQRDPGRPWVIAVHGTSMGRPSDATVLRARRLHRDLGVNVAVPVLPLHGSRSHPNAELPCVDPIDQVNGLAQAAWDIRRLLGWIRAHHGGTSPVRIGMYGVSLGGYLTSLVAGLDDTLACAVPIIPATDFPELFLRAAPDSYRNAPEVVMLTESIAEIHRLVSPLELRPLVEASGRLIIAGTADRLVDPVEQVEPLWEHWGRGAIHWFHGSHTGCLRRESVWASLEGVFTDRLLSG